MPTLRADKVAAGLKKGSSARVDAKVPAKFKTGDAVRSRNINPEGHTRLPRYARGKRGRIDADHGVFIFADSNAHGLGQKPQHLYSVCFTARELWGAEASPHDSVYIDLWDDHLDPAE